MARPGKSIAKQPEGRAGEKYLPVGGRVRKLRAVGDQSGHPPVNGNKRAWWAIYMEGAFKILVQQVVKRMSRAVPVQDLPGPIIEPHLHPLDLRAGQLSKPCPLGKELAEQPIGVLVRPSLPGRMWMGKIDSHLRLFRKQPMLPH